MVKLIPTGLICVHIYSAVAVRDLQDFRIRFEETKNFQGTKIHLWDLYFLGFFLPPYKWVKFLEKKALIPPLYQARRWFF